MSFESSIFFSTGRKGDRFLLCEGDPVKLGLRLPLEKDLDLPTDLDLVGEFLGGNLEPATGDFDFLVNEGDLLPGDLEYLGGERNGDLSFKPGEFNLPKGDLLFLKGERERLDLGGTVRQGDLDLDRRRGDFDRRNGEFFLNG